MTNSFDNQWHDHVKSELPGLINEEITKPNSRPSNNYNADIHPSEVGFALSRVKPHSASDPDAILPIMMTRAGEHTCSTLSKAFQHCWFKGIFPKPWKQENHIYIPKPEKPDYNDKKSYSSISVTNVIGKVYERIGDLRLRKFMSDTGILDAYQYAYQHNLGLAIFHSQCH